MKMIPVNSKAINTIGYDSETLCMKIQFKQGYTYTFCGVPQHIYDGFMAASSQGEYYNRFIRGRFQC